MVATVTDSGTWTHVKVPYPDAFTADGWATLATYDATGETVSTKRVEQVQIKAVYPRSHGTYPGQVRLYQTLSNPGDFSGTSILTSGVWLGYLAAAPGGFLGTQASTASNQLVLDAAVSGIVGGDSVDLWDLTTGTTETRTVASVAGQSIYLTANPAYAYPVGSLVVKTPDTVSNVPFYGWGLPPATAPKGRKLGYLSTISWPVT